MFIDYKNLSYDLFPILFMIIGLVGFVLAIYTLKKAFSMNNSYKVVVIGLSCFTILLYAGTIVLGILGIGPKYYSDYHWHNAAAWITLGLGAGTLVFGVSNLILYSKTKYAITIKEKEEIPIHKVESNEISVQQESKNDHDVLFYVKYSTGAIAVTKDYITIFKNQLPFSKFTKGRVSKIIFINDIQSVEYKGCGWLTGIFGFTFKHPNKPVRVRFGKWFVARRIKFNRKMTPVYQYILSRVIDNNK